MTRAVLILLALLLAAPCPTQGRKVKKPVATASARRSHSAASGIAPFDTIFSPAADSVAAAGFEKTLRSTSESIFITNASARDIVSLSLSITYTDMQGRMLHKATHAVAPPEGIPAGQTRMVSFPSFDRQSLFYYHLSPLPKRAVRATPFKVKVTVNYITHAK